MASGNKTPLENLKMILSQADAPDAIGPDRSVSKDLIKTTISKLREFPRESLSREEAESILRPLIKGDVA